MRFMTKAGWVLGILLLAAPWAAPRAAAEAEAGSIVIFFKDGHQQTYRLAEISRIEFTSPAERVSMSTGQARFLGEWRVGDGMGGTFIITLKPNGEAHKTYGSAKGIWTIVDGYPRVAWDDGWHDVIRKVDNHYEKQAYSPGSDLSGAPSNVAEAVYIEGH